MSELRDECYKCLNNHKCLGGAEYGSLYCMMNRKLKMQSEDDSIYAHKFATMQKEIAEKEARIKELEEDLYSANCTISDYVDSIPKQKVKDKIGVLEVEEKYDYLDNKKAIQTLEELLEDK